MSASRSARRDLAGLPPAAARARGPGLALFAVAGLVLAGCSTVNNDTDCSSDTDPMTGANFDWCGEQAQFGDATPMRADAALVRLLPVRATLGDNEFYYVRAQYQGRDWIYLSPGSELKLTVDGQAFSLRSSSGSRPDSTREVAGRYGVAVQEAADYATDAGIIRVLGTAQVVDLRLEAAPGKTVESRLSGPSLQPFREFVAVYLDD